MGDPGPWSSNRPATTTARAPKGRWLVVPGSGTGQLVGIVGEGGFDAPGGPEVGYELDYRFD